MDDPVKTRAYDGSRRRAASVQRRSRILSAARELFLRDGYVATTMSGIGAEAGVAVDTVYDLVGRKPALFRLLIESAISGQDQAVTALDRDYVHAIRGEATAEGKLAIYARALPAIHARLAPLVAVLQAAAAAEPELSGLWHEIAERRFVNMRQLAADLASTGRLRVPVEEAAEIIWATNAPEVFLLLVGQRGWTGERYSRWLLETWTAGLLTTAVPEAGPAVSPRARRDAPRARDDVGGPHGRAP